MTYLWTHIAGKSPWNWTSSLPCHHPRSKILPRAMRISCCTHWVPLDFPSGRTEVSRRSDLLWGLRSWQISRLLRRRLPSMGVPGVPGANNLFRFSLQQQQNTWVKDKKKNHKRLENRRKKKGKDQNCSLGWLQPVLSWSERVWRLSLFETVTTDWHCKRIWIISFVWIGSLLIELDIR